MLSYVGIRKLIPTVLGAGLGLAIVERIARLHNGSVELLSAPHGGALVKVILPRHSG